MRELRSFALVLGMAVGLGACSSSGGSGASSGGSGGTQGSSAPEVIFQTTSCAGTHGLRDLVVDDARIYAICGTPSGAGTLFRFPKTAAALAQGDLTSPTDTSRQMVVLGTSTFLCEPTRLENGVAWIDNYCDPASHGCVAPGGTAIKYVEYLDDQGLNPSGITSSTNSGPYSILPAGGATYVAGEAVGSDSGGSFEFPMGELFATASTAGLTGQNLSWALDPYPTEDPNAAYPQTLIGPGAVWNNTAVFFASLDQANYALYSATSASNLFVALTPVINVRLESPSNMISFNGALYVASAASASPSGSTPAQSAIFKIDPDAGSVTTAAMLSDSVGVESCDFPLVNVAAPHLAFDGAALYWADPGPTNTANQGSVMRLDLTTAGATPAAIVSGRNRVTDVAVDGSSLYWIEQGAGSGDTTTAGQVLAIVRVGKPQ